MTAAGTSSGHHTAYHNQQQQQPHHEHRLDASVSQHYPHFSAYAQHQQHQNNYDDGPIEDSVDNRRRETFEPAMDDSPAERECDRESVASNGSEISTGALQHIREQMAISLSRMRDLEEQVKLVPLLQVSFKDCCCWRVPLFIIINHFKALNMNESPIFIEYRFV